MSESQQDAYREVFFARRGGSWLGAQRRRRRRGVGHQDCETRLRVSERGGRRKKEGRNQNLSL